MRRNASPLSLFLLGAGVFLLVLAPLLVWYVQPQAKRTPIDIDTTTVFTGTGSYFDTANGPRPRSSWRSAGWSTTSASIFCSSSGSGSGRSPVAGS
ncbi:hypothetical protein SMICM17S_00257 [Streptomyces microflavus]